MPPPLAAFITFAFIFYLYRRDLRSKPNVTRGLWIPLVWIFFVCSRGLTDWLALAGIFVGGRSLEEGSPVDRFFYMTLIGAGIYVLRQRQLRLGELMRNNRWLAAFLIYCLLSVLWSDFPFVALKRWIKVIGSPVMVLVIMTEPDPKAALISVFKRVGYIIFPVSILFIKYYPQWGRGFSAWTGAGFNTGITDNKNGLGVDCLIFGFFFTWYFLNVRRQPQSTWRRHELILCSAFLCMAWWLFLKSDSQTPFVAFGVGVFVLLCAGSRLINKHVLGTYIVVGVLGLVLLEAFFNAYEVFLAMLGRDVTLTDRTRLWSYLLRVDINPILGTGFESFWLGQRLQTIWATWTYRPNQAHNGYLETYLTLGLIGLSLLVALLLATYGKARNALVNGVEFGRFRLGFLASIIIYNWTEAAFKTTHIVFFMFYIIAFDYSHRRLTRISPPRQPLTKATPGGLRYAEQRV